MTTPNGSPITLVQPYLFFGGRCDEALEFYKQALGAEVQLLMRYKESPDPLPPGMSGPDAGEKVMHTEFRLGATTVMASDGMTFDGAKFEGFSLSITVASEADAGRFFTALSQGGKVEMPLGKTFWSPCFGMLTDQFGIGWMISTAP